MKITAEELLKNRKAHGGGQNTEDVCNYFAMQMDYPERRREIASAVGFLTANSLLRRDRRTGALYHVEDAKA